MANIIPEEKLWGLNGLINRNPDPVKETSNPTSDDYAPIGTLWVNTTTQAVYCYAGSDATGALWVTSPASGVGTFTDVTITTGDLTLNTGSIVVTAGNITMANGDFTQTGNMTITGDLAITGDFTFAGDLDLTSAALIDLTSTLDALSIYLHANGGTSEQIELRSDQGTGVSSIYLLSDVGGITLASGLASDDSFNIASTGGVDVDAAMQINLTSSEATNDCIRILGSNAASGWDVNFGTGGIDIATTGAFSIDGAAASNITLTGAFDMTLNSTAGSMIIDGGEAVADAIQLTASNAAGGITLTSGTGGITSVNTGALSLACTLASDITCTGADLTLESVGASVNIAADEAAVDAIDLDASAGGFSIDGVLASNITLTGAVDLTVNSTLGSIVIDGGEAAVDAIQLTASDVAGGILLTAGTGGITSVNTGALSLACTLASDITCTGADLTLESVGASVNIAADEAAVDAIDLNASAGGFSIDGVLASNITLTGAVDLTIDSSAGSVIIDGGEAAADAVQITASDVAGGVTLTAGTGGITSVNTGALSLACTLASDITCTGADLTLESVGASVNVTADEAANDAIALDATAGGFSIDGILESNVTVTGAGEDLNLMSVGGSVYIDGSEAVTNAVRIISTGVGGGIDIDADTGGLFMDSAGAFSLDAVAASNVTVTGAGEDLTVSSVGGSVLVQATEASATAIRLYASDAAGGLSFEGDGLTEMESANATIASPVVIATVDTNVIDILATGFTTAAGATEVFTITCNQVSTTSPIMHGCCNEGANDAQMTITRVNRSAGSFVVTVTNNGAAALNGNLHMTFWILS